MNRSRRGGGNWILFFILAMAFFYARREDKRPPGRPPHPVSAPVQNPIEEVLRPTAQEYKDGIAAAILIDTSGSMKDPVPDVNSKPTRKIEIAQRAALDIVNQFDKYAREHMDQKILVGIYEFSDRFRQPSCREVVKMGAPDVNVARDAIRAMVPDGDTPIGSAMIVAKRAVDSTALAKRHILVVTDGENTVGYSPADVTRVITNESEKDRASIYFVAFDVAASKFNPVRDAGGLVLAASNETDLQGTLNYLLSGKILAEQPEHH